MDEELKEFFDEDKESKSIDWNIWHNKVKDAKTAFQIDDMILICEKLNIAFGEDDPISYGGISDLLDTAMEWLIVHYNNKWDGEVKDSDKIRCYGFNYYRDEGGFFTIENHFKTTGNTGTDLDYIDPYIRISLVPTSFGMMDVKDLYFKIEFIVASQMW